MTTPYKLSVFVTRRNGRLTFDRSRGFAPCMIWAEVETLAGDVASPRITNVWMESDFDYVEEVLPENQNDPLYRDACAILEADRAWEAWAYDEISGQREMHRVEAYQARMGI